METTAGMERTATHWAAGSRRGMTRETSVSSEVARAQMSGCSLSAKDCHTRLQHRSGPSVSIQAGHVA